MNAFDLWNDFFANTANFFLFISAGLALLFVMSYQILANWERSEWGWNIIGSAFFLFLVLTLGVGATIFGTDFPGRQALRTLIFAGTAVFLVHHIHLLFKTQLAGKFKKKFFFRKPKSDDAPLPSKKENNPHV
jgi:hypothetical protein